MSPSNILLIQSRRPRKIKSSEQQSSSYYTIPYGDNARVKNPSRKNIVMDKIKISNNLQSNYPLTDDHLRVYEPEWMSNDTYSKTIAPVTGYSPTIDVPLLQVSFILFHFILYHNILFYFLINHLINLNY